MNKYIKLYFHVTGTHWVMDSVSMLKKGKAEVTQPDFTMLELTKSFDEFKERGKHSLKCFFFFSLVQLL